MIVLDTNVISELMRGPEADHRVHQWLRSLRELPVTTVINQAEILSGIALLPEGQRKQRLSVAANAAFASLGACLPLVPDCAGEYATIVATRRQLGRPIGGMDALVAAIAKVSGATIATRDSTDFADVGVDLIDPWASTASQ